MTLPRTTLLAGRTALVTGAASGIGRAIAAHFVAAGASIVIADKTTLVHDRKAEVGAQKSIDFDATDEAQVNDAVAEATLHLGRIDILVASHGILTQSPMREMTTATWNETLAVDLTSFFYLNRAVLPGMLERKDGRIINVSSQLGIKGGVSLTHYTAAKAGVIAMTKSLALEVSGSGVLANVIAPGPTETPLFEAMDEEWKASKRAELPLGRFGTPDEIAPTAVFLASDPGGNLYTGQTLGPNCGDVMP